MREIKFRAKENYGIDRWLYAKGIAPVTQNGTPHGEYQLIQSVDYEELDDWNETTISSYVIPETIGQYTGLKDTKGVEIYEDDILELDDNETAVVEWHDACFYVRYIQDGFLKRCYEYGSLIGAIEENLVVKVIGNIHDNPELLKSTNDRKINPQITEKENKKC